MKNYEYQKLRSLKRKIYLIEKLGNKCCKCGYNKNLAALDFHHKNPQKKSFQLDARHLSNTKMDKILEEAEKCVLICANCHRELHSPDLEINIVLEKIDKIENKLVNPKTKNLPNCIDCGEEINYGYKRCQPCNWKSKRKVERPNLKILAEEKNKHGASWCARKYGVSDRTIKKWIDRNIQ